jgi:hypothetical protein
MFERVLPRSIDNEYRGQKVALWLLGLLALMRLVIGVNSIVNGYSVMTTADGIPLAAFPPAATQTLVALWALLGLTHFFTGALCMLVLIRYRGAVPFMFVLLLLQHLAGRVIGYFHPIARTGAPPASVINLTFLILMIVGLGLSLWPRRRIN